jgi:hypothetical protein
LPNYKIQFERNVSFFQSGISTIKKEIDLVIFNDNKSECYAIELKCPLNGQYPEQMYSFVKDIKFMEQLKQLGFVKTYCVTLVADIPFYSGKNNEGIYKFFRKEYAVYGEIFKPTGARKNKDSIALDSRHEFIWQSLKDKTKYYILEL